MIVEMGKSSGFIPSSTMSSQGGSEGRTHKQRAAEEEIVELHIGQSKKGTSPKMTLFGIELEVNMKATRSNCMDQKNLLIGINLNVSTSRFSGLSLYIAILCNIRTSSL